RVAARLWPDGKSVRLRADRNALDVAGRRIGSVHNVVEAASEPERLSVDAHIAHVGAAATGDRPGRLNFARGKVENRHGALALRWSMDLVGTAIGNVELLAVAARVEAVRPYTGGDESDLRERITVHHVHAIGHHVGDVE